MAKVREANEAAVDLLSPVAQVEPLGDDVLGWLRMRRCLSHCEEADYQCLRVGVSWFEEAQGE